jgi:type I restriction-modification system DNA methylase subunit
LFLEYDKTYDSKLFTYDEKDINLRHECERVNIDNQIYYKILKETYEKDKIYSYNFADIDADVLGTMYEKYIGRIHSTRHDQGIYYTPTYIVDYIVQNTLGKVLNDLKSVRDADKVKVLDMACGSGSFLLRSFDILDEYYRENDEYYTQTLLDENSGTSEALKVTKRAMVLKNNIFGVDLDPKAVEITQLNLLLRAAETRHRLPNLMDNVKFGNSLISQSLTPEMYPMEWNKEFEDIMNAGGFDVVIGNPPYVRQEELLDIKPYLKQNYEVYHSMADLSVYFFERELKVLKEGGYFGMIVSNKWLKAGYGECLRRFLGMFYIDRFIDFGDLPVFQDATTYPCIIIIRKNRRANPKIRVCLVKTLDFGNLDNYIEKHQFSVNQKSLDASSWNFVSPEISNIFGRLKKNNLTLGAYVDNQCYFGIKTGLTEAFVVDESVKEELIRKDSNSADLLKPFLLGKEVRPYYIDYHKKYIILTKIGTDIRRYPAIYDWLCKYKSALEKRSDQGDYWYELRACDYYELFERPKLIYGSMTTGPRFAIDYDGYYANNANFFIPTEDKKLLGILNSKLGWFLIANTCTQIRGGFQLIWKYFKNVPIVEENSTTLVRLVDQMIEIKRKIARIGDARTEERRRLEAEANQLDDKIDNAVYNLYGLNEDEKKVVDRFR